MTLKEWKSEFSKALHAMINTSFMTAIFPNALNKEPNVVLINKKHKMPNCINNQPKQFVICSKS